MKCARGIEITWHSALILEYMADPKIVPIYFFLEILHHNKI